MSKKYHEKFEELAVEDVDAIIDICEAASITLKDQFMIVFKPEEGSKDQYYEYEAVGVVFATIFSAIIEVLVDIENKGKKKDYHINILDRLDVGFTTIEDDEDEKKGNYMIFINDLGKVHKPMEDTPDAENAVEKAVHWRIESIKDDIKEEKGPLIDIANKAVKKLKEFDLHILNSELIWPIFCTIYDQVVMTIRIKRSELGELDYEINFMSCFYIGARIVDEEEEKIYIRPNISDKLALKNDNKASAKFDEE